MIIERARCAAFRAGPARLIVMLEINVDLADGPLELDTSYAPRIADPQNLPV